MNPPLRLAIIGIGKIARDQHLPAIAANRAFALVAAISRHARVDGVAGFPDIDAAIASGLPIDAVVIATPPVGRHLIAAKALAAGWHVMLEKPPGATLSEVQALAPGDRTLFASWHSRQAAAVAPARAWLADKRVVSGRIDWCEDIRRWHPGQDWILAAGGLGVFDPGINALSILTDLLPALRVETARLSFPAGRGAPIAATMTLAAGTTPIRADFDFRTTGAERWTIELATDAGMLMLSAGGAGLAIDGAPQPLSPAAEYPGLYARFAALIAAGASDVDLRPLALVADAFLVGERVETEAFAFDEPAAAGP
jgi:predicted dehydrogenase